MSGGGPRSYLGAEEAWKMIWPNIPLFSEEGSSKTGRGLCVGSGPKLVWAAARGSR